MEPNTEAEAPVVSAVKEQPKNNNGLKIVTALTSVVAICGIGFGVFGMMQSIEKDNQISDLKNQVTTLNNKIVSIENDNDTSEKPTDNPSAATGNSKDYVYIGEWEIKIKIPEGLGYVDYSFINYISDGENEYPSDYSAIAFNGVASSSNKTAANEYLRQARVGNCYVASISRTPKTTFEIRGQLIYEDNNYNYVYNHAQAACSNGDSGSTTAETEGNLLIKNMLTSSSNYSKF